MKEQFITLTVLSSVIKEDVLKSLDSISKIKRDSYGRTAEDYLELNVPVPEELVINQKESLEDEKNYDLLELTGKFRPRDIIFMIKSDNNSTKIYLYSDYTVYVRQTIEEIEDILLKFREHNKKQKNHGVQ